MTHKQFLALVLAAGLTAACGSSPESMVESARGHMKKNDLAAAEIELKNALKKNPDLAEARYLLGVTALNQADYAGAESELKRALELKYPVEQVVPKLALAMHKQGAYQRLVKEITPITLTDRAALADTQAVLGNALLTLGRQNEAAQAFNTALGAVPDHISAQIGRIRMTAANRAQQEAMAAIDQVLARAPKTPEAWELKGMLQIIDGKLDDALSSWRQQIALEYDSALARTRVAGLLIQTNRLKDAAVEIELLKKQAPKLAQTHYLDALLAYRERRMEAARDAVGRLQKGAPDFIPGIMLAGLVDNEFRAWASAQKNFQRILERDPRHSTARRGLVRAYLGDNQPLRAAEALEPLLGERPDDPGVAALAGEVFLQTGDIPRSMKEFHRAAKLKPEDNGIATRVALTRFAMGKPDEAFAELENLSSAHPDDYRADITLVAARLRNREFDKALEAIAVLEKKMPGSSLPPNLRGAALLGKGDVAGARKSFERAMQIRPDDFGASMNLAQLDLATNAPQAAVARFESILAKDPKNLQVTMALADLRGRLGASVNEVTTLLERAIADHPKDPTPRVALIGHRLRNKDLRGAMAAAQQGATAIPDRPEMFDAAARAYEAGNEMNGALGMLQKLVALQPGSAYPLMRMAMVQARSKDYESARVSLRRALELAPDSIDIVRAQIGTEMAAGRDAEAVTIARKLQTDKPDSNIGWVLETDIHAARARWPQAVAAARAGLKVKATAELAIRAHSAIYAQGQPAEAARFAAEWMKANPEDVAIPIRLADMASARGDHAEAKKYYEIALRIEPANAMILNNLAFVAGKLKDPAALELAQKAHRLNPQSPNIKDTLGTLLVEHGKITEGLDLLTVASRLAPQDPSIRLNFARALIAAGKKQDARRELDTLAALGDRFPGQKEVSQLLKTL